MTLQKVSKKTIKKNEDTYYSLHTEEYKQKNAKYAKEHEDELKLKRELKKEKIREYDRIWKTKNKESRNRKAAEYQKKKRELIKILKPLYNLEAEPHEAFTKFYSRKKQELEDQEEEKNN